MRVLVAYASKHGATAGIAERIAGALREDGHDACVMAVSEVPDPLAFGAVVVGSAVYMGRWRKEARSFVQQHQAQLAGLPVWLFSSGPVGPATLPDAADISELEALLDVRGSVTFDGALAARTMSLPERLMVKAVHAPYGDFRKWEAIDAWAHAIATSLGAAPAGDRHPAIV